MPLQPAQTLSSDFIKTLITYRKEFLRTCVCIQMCAYPKTLNGYVCACVCAGLI